MDKVKQTIIFRNDLKVRKGKTASQVAHACMLFMVKTLQTHCFCPNNLIGWFSNEQLDWLNGHFTKVVLKADSETHLIELYEKALVAGLTVHKVEDNGDTEFHGVKTLTAIAIGPHRSSLIDPITKDLQAL